VQSGNLLQIIYKKGVGKLFNIFVTNSDFQNVVHRWKENIILVIMGIAFLLTAK